MKRSAELSPSQDLTTTPKVEVQILNQSQAEIIGIKNLEIAKMEMVAFRRDDEGQVFEAEILPDIDLTEFLINDDDDYLDEVLLKAERVLEDSRKQKAINPNIPLYKFR